MQQECNRDLYHGMEAAGHSMNAYLLPPPPKPATATLIIFYVNLKKYRASSTRFSI